MEGIVGAVRIAVTISYDEERYCPMPIVRSI